MRRITKKNTMPEIKVRQALFRLGYRFRLHRKDLPGTPDIVLPKYRTVCACQVGIGPLKNSIIPIIAL